MSSSARPSWTRPRRRRISTTRGCSPCRAATGRPAWRRSARRISIRSRRWSTAASRGCTSSAGSTTAPSRNRRSASKWMPIFSSDSTCSGLSYLRKELVLRGHRRSSSGRRCSPGARRSISGYKGCCTRRWASATRSRTSSRTSMHCGQPAGTCLRIATCTSTPASEISIARSNGRKRRAKTARRRTISCLQPSTACTSDDRHKAHLARMHQVS